MGSQSPALKSFLESFQTELVLGQVLILRGEQGFNFRHVADSNRPPHDLRALDESSLRLLAQFTDAGAFRPLKSAPNLQSGWQFHAATPARLEIALNHLCPGAISDLHAAESPAPPITNYREFTGRQTGMYRVTAMLNDEQAAHIISAGCHPRFCLKRRLWSVEGLPADAPEEKSLIPCLEPCPLLLEFARKGARIEQEERAAVSFPAADASALLAAVRIALRHPESAPREADFNLPENPRRLQLAAEKLRRTMPPKPSGGNSPGHDD